MIPGLRGMLRYAVPAALLVVWSGVPSPAPILALDPAKAITQYVHDVWGTNEGLPSRRVSSIVQTRDGYLWLGTQEGLARFDGVHFTVFNTGNTPGLGSNDIRALREGRDGSLWIGSYGGGLSRMQNGVFSNFTTAEGLAHDVVYTLYEDRAGSIWVGTAGGLSRLSGGRFTTYTTADGLPTDRVFAVIEDRAGDIWIGTYGGGLARMRDGEFTIYTAEDGLGSDIVFAAEEDPQGVLWFATYGGGLVRYDGAAFRRFTTRDGLSEDRLLSLQRDRDGNLWIGSYDGGLVRMRDGRFSTFTSEEGLSDNLVYSIVEDREGSLWVGTQTGLNRLRDAPVTAYGKREGLSHDRVYGVYQDEEGALWIGTEGGGLNRFHNGRFTAFTEEDGLPSNNVVSLAGGRNGSLWVGTFGAGLSHYENGSFTNYSADDGLPGNTVYSLLMDREGTLWVGTTDGLSRFRDGEFTNYDIEDGLGDLAIRALHEDAEGSLWIGTNGGGLTRMKDGRFVTYTTADGLAGDLVFSIHEDAEGVLWVGSKDGGLAGRIDGRFVSFGARDGLPVSSIFQILEDDKDNLWLSSPTQITRVSKTQLRQRAARRIPRVEVSVYGESDGIDRGGLSGGSQPSGWRSDDGRLWFASDMGIIVIDPDEISTNALPPPVYIERVVVDGRAIPTGEAAVFEPGSRNFEFSYTGLSLLAPAEMNFRYRLEGFDEGWVDAGTRRAAYYTNIPPGEYRFQVIASNNDGVWNDEGDSFSFRLDSFFYQSWWFYALVALATMAAAWGAHRLRVRQLRAREQELSRLVEERTRELEKTNEVLKELSIMDGLTGVANRRRFEERLAEEWFRARRARSNLSTVLVDLDYFKSFNDENGHQSGDVALQRVAAELRQGLRRAGDLVARYGGEEFILLLPDTSAAGAKAVADRVRSAVEALDIPHSGSAAGVVTISAGIATANPAEGGSAESLVAAADANLYRAKDDGRNRVAGTE